MEQNPEPKYNMFSLVEFRYKGRKYTGHVFGITLATNGFFYYIKNENKKLNANSPVAFLIPEKNVLKK